MDGAFGHVPRARADCRLTVVIPARDEAATIERTLAALAAQRTLRGDPLDGATYDVLVYANNCTDATAECVRAFARGRQPRIFVAEERLAGEHAHVGTARKRAMDAAAARYGNRRRAVLAATDADTRPAADWVAATLAEIAAADAVMGRIFVDRSDWNALPLHTRRMLLDEDAYQLALARVRALLVPREHDPWPHHWQRSGPSFALTVEAYRRAGGVPPLPALEDIALYDALVQSGARIRHSPRVRVWTSGRTLARARGGFGTRIAAWNEGAAGAELLVEHPDDTLARLTGTALPGRAPLPARAATQLLRQYAASEPISAA